MSENNIDKEQLEIIRNKNKRFSEETYLPDEVIDKGIISSILESDDVKVVRYMEPNQVLVTDESDRIIVPVGEYSFIDGFYRGYARVCKCGEDPSQRKWGMINTEGEEVFPTEYDVIYDFYKYSYPLVRMEKGSETFWFSLNSYQLLTEDPFAACEEEWLEQEKERAEEEAEHAFSLYDCHDSEGRFDDDRLEDAILSGEYVPEDW